MKTRTSAALAVLVLGQLLVDAAPASAQAAPHPPMTGSSLPPLPQGSATVRGVVVDPQRPGATASLAVSLYALLPDGTPGVGQTETGADGRFAFEGVSSEPSIVYLLGVRYADIPYGERLRFTPGQRELDVALEVALPTADASSVSVTGSTIQIDWVGRLLRVQETHEVTNPGDAVVFVPPDRRAEATRPFEGFVPGDAEGFQSPLLSTQEGLERRGEELVFWGPIYPGAQEIRYGYLLPIPDGAEIAARTLRLPGGTARLRVLAPEDGPRIQSPELREAESEEIEGRRFAVLESSRLGRDAEIPIEARVPATTGDRSALRLDRTELTVELDDTYLEVTQHQRIVVAPGAHLAGSALDPLLRFELAPGALLSGLSLSADEMGASASNVGGPAVDVIGPLAPGAHELSFRYRIPAVDGAADLDLRFPLVVPTLVLQTADTGVLIETTDLHRLRPQHQGTRSWLLREAFNVEPDRTISIRFSALDLDRAPRSATMAIVLGLAAASMFFVVAPLRPLATEPEIDSKTQTITREREMVYETIHDLDDDFETGKISAEDHQQMRAELREQAIELLRTERGQRPDAAEAPAGEPRRAQFCTACGERVQGVWRFCAHCGSEIAPGLAGRGGPDDEPVG